MKALKHLILCLPVILAQCLSSCNAFEEEAVDCSAQYRVRFYDDVNLKYADAFDAEVSSISLFAFDENNRLVWDATKSEALFEEGDFYHCIDISELQPGKYHLVAWGGVGENSSFRLPTLSRAASSLEEMNCTLQRKARSNEEYDLVDTDLNDLFYGCTDIVISENDEAGMHTFDLHLTKDTNRFTVILQQLNGTSLHAEDYEVVIEADNGHLNYDNHLLNDEKRFLYRAYETVDGSADIDEGDEDYTNVSTVVARLTISRLEINDWTQYTRPRLAVYNTQTGNKVLSVPLIDYLLLVRDKYHNVSSDQDYLDRQDEYSLTFFLNNSYWVNTEVVINSWRIILYEDNLESD